MAAQSAHIFFVLFAALACITVVVQSSPVSNAEEVVAAAERDGRFYGLGGSQATAFATANAGASGYPYGGGLGIASANALATAGSNDYGYGYPYGK